MTETEKIEFTAMQRNMSDLSGDIKEIKSALLGNQYGDPGMIYEVKALRKEIEELKAFKNKILWVSIGISSVITAGYTLIKSWI